MLFATLREQGYAALGSQRALSALSSFISVMALFLSGLGLYGLLAASVAQHSAEIGVRPALGATRGRVLRMVLSGALLLLAAGLVLGAASLVAAVKLGGSILHGVSATEPLRMIAVTGVLAATAIAAALSPALRAASIDPTRTLR